MMAVIITGGILLSTSIDNQQDLQEINLAIQQTQSDIVTEIVSISATTNENGEIEITNTSNEDIVLIQIRMYDDDGNFIASFDTNEIINGNTKYNGTMPKQLMDLMK